MITGTNDEQLLPLQQQYLTSDIFAQMPTNVAMALIQLGLKHSTLADVVRAFGREADSTTVYARFLEGCSKVAEDRLDHALWRIFTAAGQDHRGVISLVEL